MKLFSRILIANRGEIACRIIRTCRRLGISPVAIYSEADAEEPHVRLADEAWCVGPAPSAQSYLDQEAILEAVRGSGAEAVHPGFGFLAENAEFAERLQREGVVFIGPPPAAIRAMGDKITSKRIAREAGVSTVPGHPDAVASAEEAEAVAREIGFPVMLKATAGGGGKGMRIVRDPEGVREAFLGAANEARASFGDDRVFIERYVERPRHIEIQVLADSHGRILHLGERECSVQRRHQKVIEEAPSPFVDEGLRAEMGEQAVRLARAVGYVSAGTVEFIVDPERRFYFLEMNTRLQVEHPVTEMVTGLDLVEQMIRVAAGAPLELEQHEVALRGWAVEARVYAEDPERGFLPATGRLVRYDPPPEGPHLRVDAGVEEGSEISVYYDPMIAKVIGYGVNRAGAIGHLREGLERYTVRGLSQNIDFLGALLRDPEFLAGAIDTGFIERRFPEGFRASRVPAPEPERLLAVAAVLGVESALHDAALLPAGAGARSRAHELPSEPGLGEEVLQRVVLVGREEVVHHPVRLAPAGRDGWLVWAGEHEHRVERAWRPGMLRFEGLVGGHRMCVQVERVRGGFVLAHGGHRDRYRVLAPRAAELERLMPVKRPPDMSRFVLSPMPGLLVRVSVSEGEEVKAGQEVAAVEAMKMENILYAPQDARVSAILAEPGESLAVDQPIVRFE